MDGALPMIVAATRHLPDSALPTCSRHNHTRSAIACRHRDRNAR